VNVEHLIYAKTLSSARKSQYVVTFQSTDRFRVLLMDISQAAFGLDMSSASRVYFVNPVLNTQVEAQAIKRAHRIGQTKPVHVETLVLRSTIEEIIVKRRDAMSTDEQKKCKTVLDDETMYDWIRNVKFISLPEGDLPGVKQMASLEKAQKVFGRYTTFENAVHDPDSGLIIEELSPKSSDKGKGKAKAEDASPTKKLRTVAQEKRRAIFNQRRNRVEERLNAEDDTLHTEDVGRAESADPSPSKSDKSRLSTQGARSLIVKLETGKAARSRKSLPNIPGATVPSCTNRPFTDTEIPCSSAHLTGLSDSCSGANPFKDGEPSGSSRSKRRIDSSEYGNDGMDDINDSSDEHSPSKRRQMC